jgi:hypothetical protein
VCWLRIIDHSCATESKMNCESALFAGCFNIPALLHLDNGIHTHSELSPWFWVFPVPWRKDRTGTGAPSHCQNVPVIIYIWLSSTASHDLLPGIPQNWPGGHSRPSWWPLGYLQVFTGIFVVVMQLIHEVHHTVNTMLLLVWGEALNNKQ